jgi:SPP1 family predicted phage head-tail adaptor
MPVLIQMPAGLRPHRVTLDNPGPPVATSDGGFTESVVPLQPSAMFANILPVLERNVERATGGGTVIATATHRVTIPFHPQVTIQTRLRFNGRSFSVVSVTNTEERNVELVLLCVEVAP